MGVPSLPRRGAHRAEDGAPTAVAGLIIKAGPTLGSLSIPISVSVLARL
jgi:hypothetical protein